MERGPTKKTKKLELQIYPGMDITNEVEDITNEVGDIKNEVEDIMCDQCIITSEFNVNYDFKQSYLIIPATKLWFAVDCLINFYYSIRNQRTVADGFRRLPAAVAFLVNSISRSLASVQKISIPVSLRSITYPGNEQELDLNEEINSVSEKSVECEILCAPEKEEDILADVIFIHGLHGGIQKTWRQGSWRNDSHKLSNQFPVRRNCSEDYYVPPRKHSMKRTLSQIYSKPSSKIARCDYEICVNNDEDDWNRLAEENNESDFSKCWPKDWLTLDCPGVRVIAVNYTTDVLWCPVWHKKRNRTDMVERSQEMIDELLQIKVGKKPIVWVGHSKGGLFIKQILVKGWEERENSKDLLDLYNQTKAIMFYSVPHRGSTLADFKFPFLRRSVELLEIQKNCDFILNLHEKFVEICNKQEKAVNIYSFIETSFTQMFMMYLKVVSYDSADPNIGTKCDVPLDHREICKPAGRDCFLYLELIKLIKKCLENNT